MGELKDLYQELILDHGKRPRNRRRMEHATTHAEGYNPLCGDKIRLQLKVDNDSITDASFEGSGCAISTASASLMTETLKGKTRHQVEQLFERFHQLVAGEGAPSTELGKLAVFSGVREYPMRVKCATLPWHTMRAALQGWGQPVSTE
jgi:nitrogen fixation NifU-like protein